MQGFNMGRYVPPEYEGVMSANQVAKKKALGSRANKSSQGILTVRFEMPYSIWCTTCPKPTVIGQGVRFNAEKKKVGNYYSTPIYSFRMKHTVCGGWIEIRTDPKNTAYTVTEGAKKQDKGEEKVLEGEIRIGATEEDRARLENDAFAALESKVEDKRQAATDKTRIEDLYASRDRDWQDPGDANRRLRKGFRVDRKIRQKKQDATEALKERMGLGFDLLDGNTEDQIKAKRIEFGESGMDRGVTVARTRPLFSSKTPDEKPSKSRRGRSKAELALEHSSKRLRQELGSNTRTAFDPFLTSERPPQETFSLRKRAEEPLGRMDKALDDTGQVEKGLLVDYDSD